MKKSDALSENLEDYLETIFDLEKANKVARAKDIAKRLGVQRGSVTGALKSLGAKGLINYEPYSFITLTKEGTKIAEKISHHHSVLRDFFVSVLQIDSKVADETACRMEHTITEDSISRLVNFIDHIHRCPKTGSHWLKSFSQDCLGNENDWEKCAKCIDLCRDQHQSGEMVTRNPQ